MLQCTKCSEVKMADEINFFKAPTILGLKPMCRKCTREYYKHNATERKQYRVHRDLMLKTYGVNKLAMIG